MPTETQITVRLLGGRLQVHFRSLGRSGSDTGRLTITGRVTGGQPGTHYILSGSDCTSGRPYPRWASGRADAQGRALLTGPTWLLKSDDAYYLILEPWTFVVPHTPVTGVSGYWLLGQAKPLRVPAPCL